MSKAKAAAAEAAEPAAPSQIHIPEFNFKTARIRVVGLTSLICHAFPDKEKKRMYLTRTTDQSVQDAAAATGSRGKKAARPVRDPQAEYLESLYPLEDGKGYGFPAIAFKRAIVGACRQVSNLDMTMANRLIFVKAPFQSKGFGCVQIIGKPKMREDVVRLSGIDKPPDIRWRGEFWPWAVDLDIEFNLSMISIEGIMRLIQYAGKSEGVGESRPSSPKKPGDNGQFRPAGTKE